MKANSNLSMQASFVRVISFCGLTIALTGFLHAVPPLYAKDKKPAPSSKIKMASEATTSDLAKWAATEALIEWQVARLAAACNEVADTTDSATARREALRFKAAYATSSYAIQAGRSPLVQALDLAAMSKLIHDVWIIDGRAKEQFGAQAQPVISALAEIRKRDRSHSLSYLSERELDAVEGMVETWRKNHPGPFVGEFIRFEAFADEVAAELGKTEDIGGMMGRLAGEANNATYLGERALLLTSRMPRLAEWHAEAAASNVLARKDLIATLASLQQLGELQRTLPEQIKVLDDRLSILPAELVAAVTNEPQLKALLAKLEQADQQVKSMESTVQCLEQSVTVLSAQLGQLNTTTHPDAMRQLSGETLGIISMHGRSLILLAALCTAGLVLLHTVLRHWSTRRSLGQPQKPTSQT